MSRLGPVHPVRLSGPQIAMNNENLLEAGLMGDAGLVRVPEDLLSQLVICI